MLLNLSFILFYPLSFCLHPFTDPYLSFILSPLSFRGTYPLSLGPYPFRSPLSFCPYPFALILFRGDTWKPVIRYDTAHGYAHIDRYNLRGRSKKERLPWSFSEALTRAERDIKQDWSVYRDRFIKGEWQ